MGKKLCEARNRSIRDGRQSLECLDQHEEASKKTMTRLPAWVLSVRLIQRRLVPSFSKGSVPFLLPKLFDVDFCGSVV